MKRATLSIILLVLASLACITTTEPFVTYPADTPTPAPVTETTEPAAGAVFEPIENLKSEIINPRCAIVTATESLHLRQSPTEGSAVVAYLHNGEQVQIIDSRGAWWKIETPTAEGWSNADFLKESECE